MDKSKLYHFPTSGYGPSYCGRMMTVSSGGSGTVHHDLPWCIADDQWAQVDRPDWKRWPKVKPSEPILEIEEYCPDCMRMAEEMNRLDEIPSKMKACSNAERQINSDLQTASGDSIK